MIMQRVQSSNLVAVGYDDATNTLFIQFNNGTYKYFNVPNNIYRNLMNASSKGGYHAAFIKDNYRYQRA
ncbi:KTSC domain-containing protein [Rossellomorea aquimaris]|uniref:KTSC domain-containing protein n=1 Tax=Rossellomorea aquimaris TaxID=189382 RepID=UPI001CD29D55|nr:KTSC domain-containing protein [Rossellomorea aquimaris]MCA1058106.1 KTSC domain-containing protein [Rossellomorea aquimaris]